MCALPSPVVKYLGKFIVETRSPRYLLVDKQGRIQEWGGPLSTYGFGDLRAGAPKHRQVDFLVGRLPGVDTPLYCPCVEIDSGLFTESSACSRRSKLVLPSLAKRI
jgi:hypothetical protein